RGPYATTSRDTLLRAFEASYVAAFTRTPPTPDVEIINVRVSASIGSDALAAQVHRSARAHSVKGTRHVYFPEFREFRPTTVYDRSALDAGQAFDGPAIVEERESTLVIGPGGRLEVTSSGNITVAIG